MHQLNQSGVLRLRFIIVFTVAAALAAGFMEVDYLPPYGQPDSLVVTKPADALNRLPAFSRTVTDTAGVRNIYAEMLALPVASSPVNAGDPVMPRSCPVQFFADYMLRFYEGSRRVLRAEYNPAGCRIVRFDHGLSARRSLDTTNSFNDDLQKALGLSDQDYYGIPAIALPPSSTSSIQTQVR